MFSIRNLRGVSLFLLGTTFLWLMQFYAATGIDTTGAAWATTGALAAAVIMGFTAATLVCSAARRGGRTLRSSRRSSVS